jgi:hypothetical protein
MNDAGFRPGLTYFADTQAIRLEDLPVNSPPYRNRQSRAVTQLRMQWQEEHPTIVDLKVSPHKASEKPKLHR